MADPPSAATVTVLLEQAHAGDPTALDRVFPLVYDQLHQLAHRHRFHWRGDYTLNTTGLVHEAYLKLVDYDLDWEGRSHFLAVAARAIRQILLDYAKHRRAKKRGGDAPKVSLDEAFGLSDQQADELVDLDEALARLAAFSPRQSQVVECRFFGGLTIDETAMALGLSVATVNRDWRLAQAWLYRELKSDP